MGFFPRLWNRKNKAEKIANNGRQRGYTHGGSSQRHEDTTILEPTGFDEAAAMWRALHEPPMVDRMDYEAYCRMVRRHQCHPEQCPLEPISAFVKNQEQASESSRKHAARALSVRANAAIAKAQAEARDRRELSRAQKATLRAEKVDIDRLRAQAAELEKHNNAFSKDAPNRRATTDPGPAAGRSRTRSEIELEKA